MNRNVKYLLKIYFWPYLLGGIILIISLFILIDTSDKGNNYIQKITQKGNNTMELLAISKKLPVCSSDTSNLFTHQFMDDGFPDFTIPLGGSNDFSHVIPTDHVYPTNFNRKSKTPVYSLGD